MGIANRVVNIFKADVHGVMDQIENQGLLLKQYLRDMEEALNQKEARLAKKMALRNQTQKKYDKYDQQYRTLDHDLTVAVEMAKDDIARMLIRKIKPLESLCSEIVDQMATLDEEISRFNKYLEQERLQYEQLKIRSAEYFQRAEMRAQENNRREVFPDIAPDDLSGEEIELELLKRKEALGPN